MNVESRESRVESRTLAGPSVLDRRPSTIAAFTLIELLVVISILGILAALAVPALKSLGKSNINAGASRQMLDDVGRARQLAMSQRTTVYMVFIPTNFWTILSPWPTKLNTPQLEAATNLGDKQLTGYTFMSYGQAGDQPGQHQWHYLDQWRELPKGTFISSQKFAGTNAISVYPVSRFNYSTNFPFPTEDSPSGLFALPYIAFNYLGQLTASNGVDMASSPEYIPLSRGSVLPAVNADKMLQFGPAAISESPPGNTTNSAFTLVAVDPLTGRPTLLYQKVQ